ncbi:tRNA pseudouridine(38-40) synthase TruA [Echinicola vietnamensis]|uniref:tRNA pseudouridine synthase A n=1 Tax=Echinicola vietnamensis (strain DSM 17526 / LMG 23754 / KMM 6221) TaxID=926556 RepID=L0FZ63_ECHVK|nr:tRNA pseudouridine(38-40) synthase TruA [Echinicola vietnamensis]AGA79219.1 pseudouridylate synthase I [Echinicola vietnamensis DSM 17526]
MKSKPFTYLFYVQYFGYRYHGWQKQPGVKTVQEMLERSFKGWLGHGEFKLLGAGRTDAGVSCMQGAFELFSATEEQLDGMVKGVNAFLPDDIRLLSVEPIGQDFNIIQDVREKEYRYYFSYGAKPHPFSAPFVVVFPEQLDVKLMQEAALYFEGLNDFRNFCTKPKSDAVFTREVFASSVKEYKQPEMEWDLQAPTYCFSVKGKGFMRNQVRLMMGTLYDIGRGKLTIRELQEALKGHRNVFPLSEKAPARGLVLNQVLFKK